MKRSLTERKSPELTCVVLLFVGFMILVVVVFAGICLDQNVSNDFI